MSTNPILGSRTVRTGTEDVRSKSQGEDEGRTRSSDGLYVRPRAVSRKHVRRGVRVQLRNWVERGPDGKGYQISSRICSVFSPKELVG